MRSVQLSAIHSNGPTMDYDSRQEVLLKQRDNDETLALSEPPLI